MIEGSQFTPLRKFAYALQVEFLSETTGAFEIRGPTTFE